MLLFPVPVFLFPASVQLFPASVFLFTASVFLFPASVSLFPASVSLFTTSMLRKFTYLLVSWLVWLAVFAAGKVGFMLYNADAGSFSVGDVADVLRHGLSMDMSTAGYLVALPWLLCLVALYGPGMWLRRVLTLYLGVAALLVGLIICGDSFLYEYWKFKLSATIFAYMGDIEGTTNSVSPGFLFTRSLAILAFAALIAWSQWSLLRILTEKPQPTRSAAPGRRPYGESRWASLRRFLFPGFAHLLLGGVIFVIIRGGVSTAVQNVGTAYYSPSLFLNHSAVNPVFSLLSSVKRSEDFGRQFHFTDEATCRAVVRDFYPATPTPGPSLLTTERPNILLVLMEGFGSPFVSALGGDPTVAPHVNALVDEGIFFDNYYSCSFRTDRGTASLLSGYVSYPTTSLMRLTDRLPRLPNLARSLSRAGYTSHYLYGGDINFTGTKGYLVAGGFTQFTTDADFSLAEAKSSKWGVCDGLTADRAAQLLPRLKQPAFMVYQTLSSHEPFEVPYNRLPDPVLNAFAYTDESIGRLVSSLKKSPAWDNLLLILVPDHGFLYRLSYESPEFYHCPMLWLGGAVREPRRLSVLMNQSDLCATLLGQLRLPHADYAWSRDVLSPDYRYPFAYSTSPSTIMFRDSTGVTLFDVASRRVVTEQPQASPERLRKAKALLQHTYSQLDALR